MRLLFKGGTVVTGKGPRRADILVEGEKILDVCRDIPAIGAQVVDVTGMLLFPGFIDAHTHFDLDVCNTTTADDFASGSRAALRGGTTTIIDFACPNKGETLAYGLGLYLSNDYAVANTMAFATLTLSQLFHAFDVRSERTSLFRLGVFSNPAMNKAFLVGLLLQAAVLLAPPLQAAFSVVPLTLSLWGVTLGLAVTPLIVCEIVKGVHRAAHPKTVQETAAAPR